MKRFLIAAALLAFTTNTLPAQDAPAPPVAEAPVADEWGMTLTEMPELLRMHLPLLRPHKGMVVESVAEGSRAAELGLRVGDILTEIDQRPVQAASDLGNANPRIGLMVIRRGVPKMLVAGMGNRPGAMLPNVNRFPVIQPNRPAMGRSFSPLGTSPGTRSSASSSVSSSVSGNGESVSVSQNGDQIMLDIASSDPNVGRVRMSGTIAEIQDQLENGELSDGAKAAVRRALRGTP
ncbi:hypothetical protein Poly51_29300 [Rubripirellula tenax]|uniref:PDZ domain-containing protein n=1 Tax=Rubripirellula tenax TaxID=2528015 RepID=A0A5C6FBN1_9BACT|nr:PDZ domain-containing protein [Rubripirellula tenax]TWU57009.1 hypothetical protein Poly51_29300 [Rubripirellula tenax]